MNTKNIGCAADDRSKQSRPFKDMVPDAVEDEHPVGRTGPQGHTRWTSASRNVAVNVVKALKRNRVQVKIPKEFQCCGRLLFTTGCLDRPTHSSQNGFEVKAAISEFFATTQRRL